MLSSGCPASTVGGTSTRQVWRPSLILSSASLILGVGVARGDDAHGLVARALARRLRAARDVLKVRREPGRRRRGGAGGWAGGCVLARVSAWVSGSRGRPRVGGRRRRPPSLALLARHGCGALYVNPRQTVELWSSVSIR